MITVEAYEGPTAPESLLREVFALWQAEDAELRPDDPPYTLDEIIGLYRIDNDRELRRRWIARDGDTGAVVGRADAQLPKDSNRDLALIEVYVLPDHRKAGAGTALVRALVDELDREGRVRIRTQIPEGTPGEDYLRGRGGSVALTNRKSRMDLSRLDRSLIRGWVEVAEREVTDRYSLVFFTRPDEHLEQYGAVRRMMNTAPRGDLEDEDWHHTPESLLAQADELEAELLERWTLVVRHDETGAFVGFTEVILAESAPEHAWQGGTAVDPAHRNHGLGRWLKAAMAERLLTERPACRYVTTENAYSNEPMLHINVAMGFELSSTLNDWQASVAAIRTALEAHP